MGACELTSKANDSYIWKAIASCWEDIKEGQVCSIGDGSTVNFWQDKWLDNHNPIVKVVPNIPADLLHWRVIDGVDENMKWKIDMLKDLLPPALIKRLCAIPVPEPHMGPDTQVWSGERSGTFTVSSAYRLLREDLDVPSGLPWKLVWKLDVPERVRSFAWQIMHGKLATKLYCRRWIDSAPNCHHCASVPESIQHVLRDCPRATSVWRRLVPPTMRANFFGLPFLEWVTFNLLYDAGSRWQCLWATSCFFLWKWRNLEVHDDNFVRPLDPASVIMQYVHQYYSSRAKFDPISKGSKVVLDVRWKPAPSGWATLNTDGASMEGRSGCGGVVREADGSWLGGFVRYLGDANAYVAELWGALEGLKLARSLGLRCVELQMDSKAVVEVLKGSADGNIDGRGLITGIRRLLLLDWQVKIIHVYREANSVADSLAAMACDAYDGLRLLEQPPAHIVQLLLSDCNGVSTPRLVTV